MTTDLIFLAIFIILLLIVFYNKKENLITNIDTSYGIEHSKYNNITEDDINLASQEPQNYGTPIIEHNENIDNSDNIETAITRGTSLFFPNSIGFTPTAIMPDMPSHWKDYNIPLSGQQDLDERLATKQQQRSNLNKIAIDGSVRSTKNIYEKYFNEELQENEDRVWWSSESQPIETDWTPY